MIEIPAGRLQPLGHQKIQVNPLEKKDPEESSANHAVNAEMALRLIRGLKEVQKVVRASIADNNELKVSHEKSIGTYKFPSFEERQTHDDLAKQLLMRKRKSVWKRRRRDYPTDMNDSR
eukprot:gnl/MRDRNA2_/MRDRNA2_196335_c0_seq1.p1 gnl/MRDRNA2_/MRDRNA2_196335_c0~~gnl/MRDRNA2_/MRDRNA2_196335_c0_seq1.p1  ORF type:complete len:119 (+),score=32.17 gnl/MRDRNA2_/MRDRNA2_196335_c0_seq1:138-494(+)